MKQFAHATLGAIAIALIASFISATLYAELSGSASLISEVKTLIVFPGLALLVPSLASTGALGGRLAKFYNGDVGAAARLQKKMMRMRVIAANGILILIPCAFFLKAWAIAGDFGLTFYIVQGVEIAAGLTNLTLLVMNMRDGLTLRRERERPRVEMEAAGGLR
ncbi:MAG: hypothetical protein U1E20_03015 [Methylocystis sp.]|uniref:hypothetical protein n=1 Tax=Methylocystis sp. TaxID=1911079 RepID=UPI003930DD94